MPEDGPLGVCYTRTGRRFFDDAAVDQALIGRVSAALGQAGFWERFETDWVCLDAELLPWSAKAQGLIRGQYAPVAAAGEAALTSALDDGAGSGDTRPGAGTATGASARAQRGD